jgi:haloacid dehalogenase superfamily, subfamily IA, variant 3 with third motif having DD or ED/haloacid dehalogenase superfamily, subfamily IA, variant 1 with third motif having Dx(3-4)D or Dx(3-4)E
MIKAVIFDMDGVIIDSEPLWEKTETILLGRRSIDYNPTYREKIMGLKQDDSAKLLKETFSLPDTIQEIIAERIGILLGLYEEELELIDGLKNLLKELKENCFLLALASGSPIKAIDFVLTKFDLKEFFSVIVSGDIIPFGKPRPDIYLHTAEQLGVKPQECVVIEDSINGVKSAKTAGMFCIALPDRRLNQDEYRIADLITDSLDKININLIKNLVGSADNIGHSAKITLNKPGEIFHV